MQNSKLTLAFNNEEEPRVSPEGRPVAPKFGVVQGGKGVWYEQKGVFYVSVTSDGTKGPAWINRLREAGCEVAPEVQWMLDRSPQFKPTVGITTKVAILSGLFFEEAERKLRFIYNEAHNHAFLEPNLEVALLMREKLDEHHLKEMGLKCIFGMTPFNGFDGVEYYLDVTGGSRRTLAACSEPACGYPHDCGFAFAAPKFLVSR